MKLTIRIAVLSVIGGVVTGGAHALADQVRPDPPRTPVPVSPLEGYQPQSGDEPLQAFEPKVPPQPSDERRSEALAWYMTGRMRQQQEDTDRALEAYLKSIEINPESIGVYQATIPLLLQNRRVDEAKELAMKATRYSDQGFALILSMAAVFARNNDVPQGTAMIEEALSSARLKPGSAQELLLHRDLGLYARLAEDYERAANEYEFVFNAVTSETLDEGIRKQVSGRPRAKL